MELRDAESREGAMTHVSLDDQPAAVRDFFLRLPAGPDGSVVELDGRPVARVLPPAPATNGTAAPPQWTPDLNRRRVELIDRKYAGGLIPAEEAELAGLQAAMHRFMDAVAPLPIAEARKLHQELMEKAARAGGGA
jgi:hypothetical protein